MPFDFNGDLNKEKPTIKSYIDGLHNENQMLRIALDHCLETSRRVYETLKDASKER